MAIARRVRALGRGPTLRSRGPRADERPAADAAASSVRSREACVAAGRPSTVFSTLVKYNGKPILSRPQHEFFRDPQNRYLQADLDGHQYNYGTRTAVKHVLNLSRYIEMGYGYVVEARKEPELPEVMCCSCRVLKFELDKAVPFPPGASIPMD